MGAGLLCSGLMIEANGQGEQLSKWQIVIYVQEKRDCH